MEKITRSRITGPLAPHAPEYRLELARLGYRCSSVKRQKRIMNRLSRWMADNEVEVGDLTSARVTEFFGAWQQDNRRRVPTERSLAPLLTYLADRHLLPPPPTSAPSTPLEKLLDEYRRYLVADRGLAGLTVLRYERVARQFLAQRFLVAGGAIGVDGLTGTGVSAFLLRETSRLAVGSAKGRVTELRALLRFLHLRGLVEMDLAAAVPPVAGWHDTRLPATLTAHEVTALLNSCDRSHGIGVRDFAILTLLVRLGLRAGEVAGMQLDDVDWRAGKIAIRGKGRRDDRLPLPVDVGEAVVRYLINSRSGVKDRSVFLTCRAPIRPIDRSSIGDVVRRACALGGTAPGGGPQTSPLNGYRDVAPGR